MPFNMLYLMYSRVCKSAVVSATYSETTWILFIIIPKCVRGKGKDNKTIVDSWGIKRSRLFHCSTADHRYDLTTPLKKKTVLNQRASKTQDMQKHLYPYCCPCQCRNSDLHCVLGWRLIKESYVTVGCSEDEPDLKQQCLAHNVSARMLRSREKNGPPTTSSSTTTSVYAKANRMINGTNMFILGILLAACWSTSIGTNPTLGTRTTDKHIHTYTALSCTWFQVC